MVFHKHGSPCRCSARTFLQSWSTWLVLKRTWIQKPLCDSFSWVRKPWGRDVILCQFPDGSKNGVRSACAQGGMIREMAHQMWRYILHARAATEVHAHQRTDNLAVLVSDDTAASLAQSWVDDGWKHGVKLLHDHKNTSKRCEFLRFNLYFCHVLLRFSLDF